MNNFTRVNTTEWEYNDSSALVLKYGGKVVSQGYVDCFEAFDISNRNHQTRQKGEDRGHIDDLIGSIESVGLRNAPTAVYDVPSNKFRLLGGHHRIISINKMRIQETPASKKFEQGFPVLVVKFDNTKLKQKEFFCVEDNNHEPAKTHSKNDVVDFLLKIDDQGHFANMSSDKSKAEIYDIIDKTFSHLGSPRTKSTIYEAWKAKRGKATARAVYPSGEELYAEARVHWRLGSDTKDWKLKTSGAAIDPNDDTSRLVVGTWDPTRKTVFMAILDGLNKIEPETYSYKIFTSVKCKVDSIVDAREKGLKSWKNWNLDQGDKHQVKEVVFRGQIDGEPHQPYVWDDEKKSFTGPAS
jgi:hypothetical protein